MANEHLLSPGRCCRKYRTSACQAVSSPFTITRLTNLVIRLVLPTLCSPRKTNLNFFKGLLVEVEKSPPADEAEATPDIVTRRYQEDSGGTVCDPMLRGPLDET